MSNKKIKINAVVDGEIIPVEEIKDPLFSNKIIGDGVGIFPIGRKIYAPIDGKIEKFAATKHAMYISSDDGINMLIHIGIDTIDLKGVGFKTNFVQGNRFAKGDTLIEFDPDFLIAEGFNPVVGVIVLNDSQKAVILDKYFNKEAIGGQTLAMELQIISNE